MVCQNQPMFSLWVTPAARLGRKEVVKAAEFWLISADQLYRLLMIWYLGSQRIKSSYSLTKYNLPAQIYDYFILSMF